MKDTFYKLFVESQEDIWTFRAEEVGVRNEIISCPFEKIYRLKAGLIPHICLCSTKNNDRARLEDMTGSRVLALDIDEEVTSDTLDKIKALKPSIIVESSPGKYHVYFKILPHLFPLKKTEVGENNQVEITPVWSKAQKALAYLFNGDHNLSTASHQLRMPGFPRILKNGTPFTPHITYEDIPRTERDLEDRSKALHKLLLSKDIQKKAESWFKEIIGKQKR